MRRGERMSPLAVVAAAAIGIAVGLVVQFGLSSRGNPPLVPPLSLPATLILISAMLLGFGIRLRRNVTRRPGAVNPFHAVRLLAAARAGQLVGAGLGGFGGGLALSLLGRSVPAPSSTWVPMVLALASGLVLVVCALIAERLCRVPPGDGAAEDGDPDGETGPADQAAYRTRPARTPGERRRPGR